MNINRRKLLSLASGGAVISLASPLLALEKAAAKD